MKRVAIILLPVVIALAVVMGMTWTTKPEAQAAPETAALLCEPPLPCATVSVPVTLTVSVPATRIITLPPQVRTIINQRTVPGPRVVTTRTVVVRRAPVTRTLPRATTTDTVTTTREVTRSRSLPPTTVTAGQTTLTPATITPKKEIIRLPGTTKTVTKYQAVGLSLLALLALMGLGLFLLWLGFVLGYKSADRENTNFLRALRDTVKRPGKHE